MNLARPYVKEPVLIIFVDTVFEADLTLINRTDADGIIWAKEVEDYQRFGVVVTDAQGYMTRIVEKPSTPISKLANIGLYYIRAVDSLWQGIDHVLANPANKGEFFLTDAFQWMIEHGKRILTAEVGGWYDCGKLDTLLETNEILLRKGAARRGDFPGVTIHDPVYIEDGVTIERSEIGPNVSLEQGTRVTDSRLANTIVGRDATLTRVQSRRRAAGQWRGGRGLTGHARSATIRTMTREVRAWRSASRSADAVRRRALPVLPGPQVPLRSGRRQRRRAGGAGRPAGPLRRRPPREHVAALRSVAGAVEELEPEDLHEEIDRTALLGELRTHHLPAGARAAARAEPELLAVPSLSGSLRRSGPAREPTCRRGRPRCSRGSRPSRRFLDAARETLDEPPSVFVDSALRMLGGGGQLIAQLAGVFAVAAPELADELAKAAGRPRSRPCQAVRRRAARRDRAEPPIPTPSPSARSSSPAGCTTSTRSWPGAPELWRYGLHLQEEITAEIVALAAAPRPAPLARAWWTSCANDAPPRRPAARRLSHGARPGARNFVTRAGSGGVPDGAGRRGAHAVVS